MARGSPSRGWPTEPTVPTHCRWGGTGTGTPAVGVKRISPRPVPR